MRFCNAGLSHFPLRGMGPPKGSIDPAKFGRLLDFWLRGRSCGGGVLGFGLKSLEGGFFGLVGSYPIRKRKLGGVNGFSL